jgi:hypothetical protein
VVGRRAEIARQLASLRAAVTFVNPSGDFSHLVDEGEVFQVAILPASLSDTDCWLFGAFSRSWTSDERYSRMRAALGIE